MPITSKINESISQLDAIIGRLSVVDDPTNTKDAEFLEPIWLRIKQSAEICANAARDGVYHSRVSNMMSREQGRLLVNLARSSFWSLSRN
ncbi:hypothetical protein BC937DRAFT_89071 [Endogone sp. FLAS-F59071]|nr:hypothetical protein BC937DRAFT_89071 [Endogone sp. FLAS-F59071]|eukprot:RUS18178.1 hypothetical protein BC937DRAFT_89071 [Endogone sp. FLAS-F59071]